jgi:fengycin family lipopeptide synthetase D
LSGDLSVSHFPRDYNKTYIDEDSARGSKNEMVNARFQLGGELFSKLMKISKNSDSRLFIILVMGLVLLLRKYTGHEDIILGAPIDKQAIEGELINKVLALRNCLTNDMTIKELLFQVRQTIVEACENQNYPL